MTSAPNPDKQPQEDLKDPRGDDTAELRECTVYFYSVQSDSSRSLNMQTPRPADRTVAKPLATGFSGY